MRDGSPRGHLSETNPAPQCPRNHRVQRLTAQGAYSAAWGGPGTAPSQFNSPQGLAIDAQGVLYVADTDNNRVQRINLAGT